MARITFRRDVAASAALKRRLEALPGSAVQALAGALYREAETIMAASKREVPVRFGALLRSGQVQEPVISAQRIDVAMGYGNDAVQYALIVHERLDVYHKPPTKAKYLEDPLNAATVGMVDRLAAGVRPALGSP